MSKTIKKEKISWFDDIYSSVRKPVCKPSRCINKNGNKQKQQLKHKLRRQILDED